MPRNPRADQIGTGGRIKSESPGGCARNAQSWRKKWPNLSVYFKYPADIRRVIYTTNAIQAVHRVPKTDQNQGRVSQ